ncbi:MAG: hypothetical protein EBU90_30490, partial [Proteobacteria bacterium]|nr:hypothetical protein [Pseudomonadota bacterium]
MGYRNIVYDNRNRCVHLFTWDAQGNRVKYELPFSPYLYVENPKGTHTSIFNTKLLKKTFLSSYDRNKFVKESGIKRLFEHFSPTQHFLLDNFWKQNESEAFSKQPLKVCFLDIETYSVDSFPTPSNPTHTVNVITCYDTLTKTTHTFGLKPYTGDNKTVKYVHCADERQ